MDIIKCNTGEIVRQATEQEEQVYNIIEKWSKRLNTWEYSKQTKRKINKKLKTFSPNALSLQLIENRERMINGEIAPEEALSLLYSVEGKTQTRLCMEAGF